MKFYLTFVKILLDFICIVYFHLTCILEISKKIAKKSINLKIYLMHSFNLNLNNNILIQCVEELD